MKPLPFKLRLEPGDSLIIQNGIDEQGLYWENRRYRNINIGFKSVKKSEKDKFRKIISTFDYCGNYQ